MENHQIAVIIVVDMLCCRDGIGHSGVEFSLCHILQRDPGLGTVLP